MKRMFLNLIILIISISNVFATNTKGIMVPLTYYPQYGIYTTPIKIVTDETQEAEAIVDTGSFMLVFVGDKANCPSCAKPLTKGAFNPKHIKGQGKEKIVNLQYASADDLAYVRTAPIQYDEQPPIPIHFFILLKSTQPTSILGMLPGSFYLGFPGTAFIQRITDHFNLFHQMTFVLCGMHGNSYYHIGPLDLPKPIYAGHLLNSHYYEIPTLGFYDEKNKAIVEANGRAMIDTGTGGFIVLTSSLHKTIVNYIYEHTSTSNKQLGSQFWKNNYCAPVNEIDFSSLPTVKIAFKDANRAQPFYIEVPGTTYVDVGGCGKGYARLVFVTGLPSGHPHGKSKNFLRKKMSSPPDMVIGTSLLNHYVFRIDYEHGFFYFYDNNKTMCMRPKNTMHELEPIKVKTH